MGSKLKKGDKVLVIKGKEKGKSSTIEQIIRDENRVIKKVVLKDLNLVKKHLKAIEGRREGGIYAIEAPISVSNVMLICPKCNKPTRVGFKIVEEENQVRKYRFCKKCGESIDLVREKVKR